MKANAWRTGAFIGGSLLAMAALDFHTGQELVFSCAYLLPISLTAWWFGRRAMLAMAVLCGIAAYWVDILDGYEYSHPGIAYWNAFTCLLIGSTTGYVLERLKEALQEREQKNEQLTAALIRLEASTAEIRKLQTGLQTVCAFTKKVKIGDEWISPDEFLTKHLHLKLSHGISPEAFEQFLRGIPNDPDNEHRKAS